MKTAARDPQRLVDAALDLLDRCDCDDSCYQCLRSYKNRYDHALFDRRIGADLLRACFKGAPLAIEPGARGLCARPTCRRSRGKRGPDETARRRRWSTRTEKSSALPILSSRTEPCSARARKLAEGKDAVAVDILLVLRALPIASSEALSVPNVDLNAGLKLDADGVPEFSAAQVIAGDLVPGPGAPRFAVNEAQEDDFLFKLDANTLSGKADVARGTMCLFRPFSGESQRPMSI